MHFESKFQCHQTQNSTCNQLSHTEIFTCNILNIRSEDIPAISLTLVSDHLESFDAFCRPFLQSLQFLDEPNAYYQTHLYNQGDFRLFWMWSNSTKRKGGGRGRMISIIRNYLISFIRCVVACNVGINQILFFIISLKICQNLNISFFL